MHCGWLELRRPWSGDYPGKVKDVKDMKKISMIGLVMVVLSLLICAAAANVISVGNGQVTATGSAASVNLVLDEAPAGLSGYSINVNVSDPTVASITGVSFPAWATMKDNTTFPAPSCNLKTADLNEQVQAGATSIPLATLTITGLKAGSTTIMATVVRMNDDNDARLTPAVQAGTFTVNVPPVRPGPVIADHNNATLQRLAVVPESAIEQASSTLHIAYGHTSHGSQITDGMTGLTTFASAQGGGSLYRWNNGGSGGALDLRDTPFQGAGDLGNPDYTAWATATRNYLNSHHEINTVMWSWCGEADTSAENINTYLTLMNQLEQDYPDVTFVYMTGHLVGTGVNGNLNQRNEQIRAYCRTNNKVLFDFADIESYDPDGLVNYMALNADDGCNYNGGNWATAWQNSHTEGVDWYQCGAAHTQPLNANMKAYAAWWMWARLGGWDGTTTPVTDNPVPVLNSVSPDSVMAGGPAFSLTIQGSDFVPGSSVRWNGSGRTTTYVSATTLTASIPAADITGSGTARVTVFNPAPGGGTSSEAAITISGTPLQNGNISVTTTPPGAAISLDGSATGRSTPYVLTEVPAGSHTVAVSLSGYDPQNQNVNVVAGQTVNADFQLTQTQGHTVPVVTGQVEGAVVVLNWDVINDADLSGYKVVISKNNSHPKYPEDGYMFWITDRNHNYATIDNVTTYNGGDIGGHLQPGQKYYFSVTALYNDNAKVPGNVIELVFPSGNVPQDGSLAISSQPPGAAITIDGFATGQVTPVTFNNVPAGSHTVSVVLQGYLPDSMVVTVTAGATANVAFTLTQATQEADLAITKVVSSQTADIGENVTWTVTVTNSGPDAARDIVIEDTYSGLPGVVIRAVNTPTAGTITGTNWQIPALEKDQSARLSVVTSFTTAGNKTNTALVGNSSASDPDTSDNSASASVIIVEQQVPAPVAGFMAVPVSGNAPLTVQFTDTSTGTGITSWAWDFDNDGVIDSTSQNPAYTYASAGTYSVNLTVMNAGGSGSELKTDYISVSAVQPDEIVLRIIPASPVIPTGTSQQFQLVLSRVPGGLSGGNISVTLSNPSAGTITAISPPSWAALNRTSIVPASSAWVESVDIGRNVQAGATDVPMGVVTIEGITPGETEVILAVLGLDADNGAVITSGVVNGHIAVTPQLHADFTAVPVSGNAPLTVQFTDTSTGTGITSWAWDFNNDGVVDSTSRNPAYTYASAGTYSVNLTVTNAGGSDSELKSDYISVTVPAPDAGFNAVPVSGTAPLAVQFTDISTGTGITSWAWDFNNDGVIDSTSRNPAYTYASAGTYSVNLTVTNAGGSDYELKTDYITVSEAAVPPVAGFNAVPVSGTAPLSVQFNDTSTGTGITSWAWDFNNDGVIDSNNRNPAYTYASAGTYSVNLTVTNAGGSDYELKTDYITVTEPPVPPAADFSADNTTGTIPFTVHFTDLSTGTGITTWGWDLNGDGTVERNDRNPVYTYEHPGRYTVNLTVTSATGTDTMVRTNYIVANRYVEPFPGYSRTPTDPDFDGIYEDINGNGRLDFDDVVAFYMNMQWVRDNSAVGIIPYDLNNNGRIDYDDVVQLYQEVLNG
jgi:uncharacterized repeat protein (TIGR01451 family)